MSYKYIYTDPDTRLRVEGVIESALRDRNMELAFVREAVRQHHIAKSVKKTTAKKKDDITELIAKVGKDKLAALISLLEGAK